MPTPCSALGIRELSSQVRVLPPAQISRELRVCEGLLPLLRMPTGEVGAEAGPL